MFLNRHACIHYCFNIYFRGVNLIVYLRLLLCLCFFLADKCKVRVPFGLLKTTASTASLLFLNPVDSQFIFFVYKSYRLKKDLSFPNLSRLPVVKDKVPFPPIFNFRRPTKKVSCQLSEVVKYKQLAFYWNCDIRQIYAARLLLEL